MTLEDRIIRLERQVATLESDIKSRLDEIHDTLLEIDKSIIDLNTNDPGEQLFTIEERLTRILNLLEKPEEPVGAC